jgi:hypothetical protein
MATTGAAPPGSRREDNGGTTRRSLVTTQPVTLCDLCGRRLLRGEHPQKFFGEDRILLVCELCVPRAIRAQWSRLDDRVDPSELAAWTPPDRSRRPFRGFLARLRTRDQASRPPATPPADDRRADRAIADGARADGVHADDRARAADGAAWRARGAPGADGVAPMADDARATAHRAARGADDVAPTADRAAWGADGADGAGWDADRAAWGADGAAWDADRAAWGADAEALSAGEAGDRVGGADHAAGSLLATAVGSFNASHEPRRIAGIARALGAPAVSVRLAAAPPSDAREADGAGRVEITAAWELCWYRWLVDPAQAPGAVELVASGDELDQLGPDGIEPNAQASARGALRLDAAA